MINNIKINVKIKVETFEIKNGLHNLELSSVMRQFEFKISSSSIEANKVQTFTNIPFHHTPRPPSTGYLSYSVQTYSSFIPLI